MISLAVQPLTLHPSTAGGHRFDPCLGNWELQVTTVVLVGATKTKQVRGDGREDLPHAPKPEAKGSGREEQLHVQGAVAAWAQEGLEELSHNEGQEGQR